MNDQTENVERVVAAEENPYRALMAVDQMLADPEISASSTLANEHRGEIVRQVYAGLRLQIQGGRRPTASEVKDQILAAFVILSGSDWRRLSMEPVSSSIRIWGGRR